MISFLDKYAARIAPDDLDKDESALTHAQRPELEHEWLLWLEAIRKELTSLNINH
jgi:hypothetical protein